jgi:hypothetical protein
MGNKTLTGTLESLNDEVKEWFSKTLPWEELIDGQDSVVGCKGKLQWVFFPSKYLKCVIHHWQIYIQPSNQLQIIIYTFQSLKINLLTRQRIKTAVGPRVRTCLCYNPTLQRMTCAIFQAEGVQVSIYLFIGFLGLGKGLTFFLLLFVSFEEFFIHDVF